MYIIYMINKNPCPMLLFHSGHNPALGREGGEENKVYWEKGRQ
jgi:hypothetical protein